jgi:predicted site-specific integrase-resolvase
VELGYARVSTAKQDLDRQVTAEQRPVDPDQVSHILHRRRRDLLRIGREPALQLEELQQQGVP